MDFCSSETYSNSRKNRNRNRRRLERMIWYIEQCTAQRHTNGFNGSGGSRRNNSDKSLLDKSANGNVCTVMSLVAHIYMNVEGKAVVKSGVIT